MAPFTVGDWGQIHGSGRNIQKGEVWLVAKRPEPVPADMQADQADEPFGEAGARRVNVSKPGQTLLTCRLPRGENEGQRMR